jgi:hypothetical protein
LEPVQGALGLGEDIKQVGQQRLRNAFAGIPDPNDGVILLTRRLQPNCAAFGRIFGGIVEQIDTTWAKRRLSPSGPSG